MAPGAGYTNKVRVGAVLIHENKLLLARQNNRPFWVLPGGTLEPEEAMDVCAVREMQEESNLTVAADRLLYLADFIQPQSGSEGGVKHAIDVFFMVTYQRGDLQMETSENLNEIGFFDRDAVQAMAIQPAIIKDRLLEDWDKQFEGVQGVYLGAYQPE